MTIKAIPDDRLSQKLFECGLKKAEMEKLWAIADHQRLPVLAEITGWFQGSHAAAEREARVSKEYQEFIAKRAEAKKNQIEARIRYDVIKLEIQMRINRSFERSREYNAERLNT